MMRGLSLGAAFFFPLIQFSACAQSTHDTPGYGTHPDGGDDDGSVISGGQCPTDTLPTDNACAINEKFGLFVSSSRGSPAGDGSMARPFPSVQQAIDAAKTSRLRVYACAESFKESLTLADGVSLFGYFDCSTPKWTVSHGRARIDSPASPAATVTGAVSPTRIEAFEFNAPDATAPSASSIGWIAVSSPGVSIYYARIHAGTGKKGADGVDGIQLTQNGTLDGTSGVVVGECGGGIARSACDALHSGGLGGTSVCNGAPDHTGGQGGNGGFGGQWGHTTILVQIQPATFGSPQPGTATTAVGANDDHVHSAAPGGKGADGANGASSAALGAFSAQGYAPADGAAGADGKPGTAGGGGAGLPPIISDMTSSSTDWYGPSGAGGGAGGCPGLAGTAGKGGGASIAIVAIDSPLHIHKSTIEASQGGDGGKGTFGSNPTRAGTAGVGVSDPKYGPNPLGGYGGGGGLSGLSGHGAGGPSIAIVHHGGAPDLDATVPTVGAGGAGQVALTSGAKVIAASIAGASAPTFGF